MKGRTLLFYLAGFVLLASWALAVPPGKKLVFEKSHLGEVVFDGTLHNKIAKGCKECHNENMFPKMEQGTVTISMEEIYQGKLCGTCHNGERAFKAKTSCTRCHTRK